MPSRYERPGAEPPWARRPGGRRFGSESYRRGRYERPEREEARKEEEEELDPFEVFRPGGPRKPAPRAERREEPRRPERKKAPAWYEIVAPEEEPEAPPSERTRVTPVGPGRYRYGGWRDVPRRGRVDLARFFPDLEDIWKRVQRHREDPRWRSSPQAGIFEISAPTGDKWEHARKVADFLGIPRGDIEGYSEEQVWRRILGPVLEEISDALNAERPRALPGEFIFGFAPNNAFGLIYAER